VTYAGYIVVADAEGSRFRVHEFRGQHFFSFKRRFRLSSGEKVRRIDFDNYEVARTGERLVRVKVACEPTNN
jgi:hypothetical protein